MRTEMNGVSAASRRVRRYARHVAVAQTDRDRPDERVAPVARPGVRHDAVVTDTHDLQRFVDAQDRGGTYDTAVTELRTGRKTSHWMWFVFPQLAGLGHSPMAQTYAIRDLREAHDYLAHPVLGERLRQCVHILLALPTDDPEAVLGDIDALKLRSSMTLFGLAAPEEPVFAQVLEKFYRGEPDPNTTRRV